MDFKNSALKTTTNIMRQGTRSELSILQLQKAIYFSIIIPEKSQSH